MFKKLFKKKKMITKIYQPVSGQVIPLNDVTDDIFSTEMMGIGFAVRPTSTVISSPLNGTIVSVFPTKHAVTICGDDGLEVLLHVGIDTVELKGEGFTILINEGQKIKANESIMKVDFDYLATQGKRTDVIVIFPSLDRDQKDQFNFSNTQELIAKLS